MRIKSLLRKAGSSCSYERVSAAGNAQDIYWGMVDFLTLSQLSHFHDRTGMDPWVETLSGCKDSLVDQVLAVKLKDMRSIPQHAHKSRMEVHL